jgi:hypothetical protein
VRKSVLTFWEKRIQLGGKNKNMKKTVFDVFLVSYPA